MSPHSLGALALSWSPPRGLFASGELSAVGSRYLDKRNRALAGAYATLGALLGWRNERLEVRLSGRNLTDRRDPVSESELGDAQYYRLFPRRIDLAATVSF
jgi:outer membrane receptor protein involved in Fe transport